MYLGRTSTNGAITSHRAIQYMSESGHQVAAQAKAGIQKAKYAR
jgi:hypothetical protein